MANRSPPRWLVTIFEVKAMLRYLLRSSAMVLGQPGTRLDGDQRRGAAREVS
jgi:hypothetical protein